MAAARHPLLAPTREVAALQQFGRLLKEKRVDSVPWRYAGPEDPLERFAEYRSWYSAKGGRRKLAALQAELRFWLDPESVVLLIPLPLTVAWQLRGSLAIAVALAVVVLVALLWLEFDVRLPELFPLLVWPATIVVQIATGESEGLLFSHLLPLGVAAIALGTRPDLDVVAETLGLAIPATVLLVLLSLLTTEIWELAAELSLVRVVLLGVFLVAPLVALVYSRIRRRTTDLTVDIVDFENPAVQTQIDAELERTLAQSTDAELALAGADMVREAPSPAWSAVELREAALEAVHRNKAEVAPAFLPIVAPLVRSEFRKRFAVVVPTAIAALTLLFYALAAIAVPLEVAERWSARPGSAETLDVLGLDLPIAPHLAVAFILALAATAIFLGFLLMEKEHVDSLADAIFVESAESIMYGLPYAALAGAAIQDMRHAGFVPTVRVYPEGDEPGPPRTVIVMDLELPLDDFVTWYHVDNPRLRELVAEPSG